MECECAFPDYTPIAPGNEAYGSKYVFVFPADRIPHFIFHAQGQHGRAFTIQTAHFEKKTRIQKNNQITKHAFKKETYI